jgi:hypothetical protein
MQVLEDRKAKPANQELMDRVAALEIEFKESKDKVSSLQMATGLRRNG